MILGLIQEAASSATELMAIATALGTGVTAIIWVYEMKRTVRDHTDDINEIKGVIREKIGNQNQKLDTIMGHIVEISENISYINGQLNNPRNKRE